MHYAGCVYRFLLTLKQFLQSYNKSAQSNLGRGPRAALSDTGRFDNEGESGRRKTESLLRRTSLCRYCELSQHM